MTAIAANKTTVRKDDVIQIRASVTTKALLHRAATIRGQKLSEFMLESARQQAETTLLDQRLFLLDARTHQQFVALLDKPVSISPALRARMRRPAPWQH